MEASAHFLHSLASIRSHCSGYTALAKAVTGLNTEATLTCYMLSSYAGTIWGYVLSSYIGTIFSFSFFFFFFLLCAVWLCWDYLFVLFFCFVICCLVIVGLLRFFTILFFYFFKYWEYNKSLCVSWFENFYSRFLPIVGLFQGLPGRLDWFLRNTVWLLNMSYFLCITLSFTWHKF